MPLVDVAVPVPLRQTFTYSCDTNIAPGCRVRVPFGNRSLVGVVIQTPKKVSPDTKLKAVDTVLDESPLVSKDLLKLAKWLSDYYHHPIGETLHVVLPGWLRKAKTDSEILSLIEEKHIAITESGKEALPQFDSRHKAQKLALEHLAEKQLSKAHLLSSTSKSTLKTLLNKGLIEELDVLPDKGINWMSSLVLGEMPVLNHEQGAAVGVLEATRDAFSVSLLEGVTGSGKTEVYLQLIASVLLSGKQVLVLVPEIGLTPQTVTRFKQRFQCEIGVLNSQVSDRERTRIWQRAARGALPLVIGTRSAVFTPFLELGLIVIDEEHDDAYKQQDGLRYHARDVAIMRAKSAGVPVLLGSATPSLESLNNAINKRYRHLLLAQRAGAGAPVSQHVLDMRDQPVTGGIAQFLLEKMEATLARGEQVLVFLNRRGFAPLMLCHHCGHVFTCPCCERPLTWHRQANVLKCHQCDITVPMTNQCPACHSNDLVSEGLGTEQLEAFLHQHFSHYRTLRLDRDTASSKKRLNAALEAVNERQAHIIIGTQMIAKGHHFPGITLVVVVDVDAALFSTDIRATEKLGQLVTQVSGRAGRAGGKAQLWLQSHHPQHMLLQELIHNGYAHVARLLLSERKHLCAPPFAAQAIVRVESEAMALGSQILNQCARLITPEHQCQTIGPMPALIEKKQGRYRWLMILRSEQRRTLHFAVRQLTLFLAQHASHKMRWSVDIDAIDVT